MRRLPLFLFGVVFAVAGLPGRADAHRLEADYHVLPGNRVQVESWFDLTGESPKGAEVLVFRTDGSLMANGRLDEKGIFVFAFDRAEVLRIVVSAGAGHQAEVTTSRLEPAAPQSPQTTEPGHATGPMVRPPIPLSDRSPKVSFMNVLGGVGVIFGLAAGVIGLRTIRRPKARRAD